MPVTIEEVREVAMGLPRTREGMVRGKVRFYVGRIVYVALEREGIMGFAFPREWREAAVDGEPEKFLMPTGGDLRHKWLLVRMDAIGAPEMRELVTDAWSIVVPQKVIDAYLRDAPPRGHAPPGAERGLSPAGRPGPRGRGAARPGRRG